MGFGAAIASCFGKYATFSGRAPRSEYWWWILFTLLLNFGGGIVGGIIGAIAGTPILTVLVVALIYLGLLLPWIAVGVRRLHDLNRSGWWYGGQIIFALFLLALAIPVGIRAYQNHAGGYPPMDGIPPATFIVMRVLDLIQAVYSIVLFIWFCMAGTRGQNRFGPDPLRSSPDVSRRRDF
jgi:uncharacterized membrane protein YhaH (DUF805 family)